MQKQYFKIISNSKKKNFILFSKMNFVKNICIASDLFKSPISLLFNSQHRISTTLGIILSMIIFIFLFISFLNSDFFLRKNPNVSDSMTSNENVKINLDQNNFGIILSLVSENEIDYEEIDPSYLNVEAQLIYYNDTYTYIAQNLTILNFTKDIYDRFAEKSLILGNDKIINLNLTEKYGWNSNYSFLSVSIKICDNETSKVKCKPLDEILDFVHGKYFYASFLEYFYDLNDFEKPAKVNTQNVKYFQLNKNIYNLVSFSLMEVGLYQDSNFYFDVGEEQFYASYQQDPSQYFTSFSTLDKNDIISKKMLKLGEYLFYPSLNKRKIVRKYQKMPEAFSQIGGLLTVLKIFGFMFCSLSKYIKILQSISEKFNENIKIFESEKPCNSHDSVALEHKSLNIQNFSLSNSIEMFRRNQQDLGIKEKREINNQELNSNERQINRTERHMPLKHVKKKFNLTFFKYLKYIIYQHFKMKKNDDFNRIQLLEIVYLENFDFINILKVMNEMEKLKSFLFDSKQKEIFELIDLEFYSKKESFLQNTDNKNEKLQAYVQNIMKKREFKGKDKKLIELYHKSAGQNNN